MPASGRHLPMSDPMSLFERLFQLQQHGTTVRTELLAGVTTFLTMSYIVFVNPEILGTTGMDAGAVFVATCLAAALGSAVMALAANFPVGMAPGMGLNAFFAFTVVGAAGLPWQQALGAVFISGLVFLVLSLTGVRAWLVSGIPSSLRSAIVAGIGLFLAIIALQKSGVIVGNEDTLVALGPLNTAPPLLALAGFLLIAVLEARRIRGAILIGILAAPAADTKPDSKDDRTDAPALPADASARQSMRLAGRTLDYTATVGTLPVRDEKGKVIADVVFTAYTMPGKDRPVTFALNGGPGASSVYLNMGAIGPKVVTFGSEGDSASAPATLHDNPGTWLDFTDLVFIDPVGTGFSRARIGDDEAKKQLYNPGADIEYLSRSIYDWLLRNQRMASRKYLTGESYGGYRGPRITHFLQTRLGVAMNGLVLVSPYLSPTLEDNADVSPMAWMQTLPSIAAAHLERQGRLTDAAMREVVEYTRGDYATALMKGRSDPQATEAMLRRVTELTGLDPQFVRRAGGRLETQAYLREVFRDKGTLGSRYDSNVTAFDPFPNDPEQRANDPLLDSIIAPTTTAMVDFVTRVVGWKVDARYQALNYDVNRLWDRNGELRQGAVTQLRQAVAIDPHLQVLIVHGWNDLSCPFMGSILTVDQMPAMGSNPDRVQVRSYPGGHMFYSRADSQAAFRKDVQALFQRN
ncbi:solute carrier family 23 protein [Stenotrophomonas maltophilia]|nr:solute carrier family 23 protein [Stenotrophomonas maltophilia]WMR47511.1 solute carrier family 23 protein [Stenotrophomonas maltophilia]